MKCNCSTLTTFSYYFCFFCSHLLFLPNPSNLQYCSPLATCLQLEGMLTDNEFKQWVVNIMYLGSIIWQTTKTKISFWWFTCHLFIYFYYQSPPLLSFFQYQQMNLQFLHPFFVLKKMDTKIIHLSSSAIMICRDELQLVHSQVCIFVVSFSADIRSNSFLKLSLVHFNCSFFFFFFIFLRFFRF